MVTAVPSNLSDMSSGVIPPRHALAHSSDNIERHLLEEALNPLLQTRSPIFLSLVPMLDSER